MRDDLEIPPPGFRVGRRAAGIDPATRRLSMIAATIGGALVVLVGIWSMVGGSSHGVPVVPSPPGPMRVKPANPGGMQVAGATDRILSDAGTATATSPALAPPPETPDLSALHSPPPAASSPPVATTVQTPAPSPPPATHAASSLPLPPPAPPPVVLAAASTAAPPPPGAGTGPATQVQLAALSSEQGAMQAWQKLQASLPSLFGAREPLVEKVEVDGHTFWRLRTGGFANVAEATQFCKAVRSTGSGCTIAAF